MGLSSESDEEYDEPVVPRVKKKGKQIKILSENGKYWFVTFTPSPSSSCLKKVGNHVPGKFCHLKGIKQRNT